MRQKKKRKSKKKKSAYCQACPLYPDGKEPRGKLRKYAIQLCQALRKEEECPKTRVSRSGS